MSRLGDMLSKTIPVGRRIAPNRFAANPVERNKGTADGSVSDDSIAVYKELALGGWGLVIVESTTASANVENRGPGKAALVLNSRTVSSFKMLVNEFKAAHTDSLLILQISPGAFGRDDTFRTLSTADLERTREELTKGILLAHEAGFDGIDFKQCHGFLPGRLLGRTNTRKDRWGGKTVRERSVFARETLDPVWKYLKNEGKDRFLVGTRISEIDLSYLRTMVEMFEEDLPFDFLNISASPLTNNAHAVFLLTQAVKLAGATKPLIASAATDAVSSGQGVGRIEDLMYGDLAPDFIGFGKQALADPFLPAKILAGENESVNWCTKCDACWKLFDAGKPVSCVQRKPC